MFNQHHLDNLDDYFTKFKDRKNEGVYFCRINSYNTQIHTFIKKYLEEVRNSGIIIENKLQNPDGQQLTYYKEILGTEFVLNVGFFYNNFRKWLPRLNTMQAVNISDSIYYILIQLKNEGKNINVLKNIYIKFMCWLYYNFERLLNHLGDNNIPKVLYEGYPSYHELLFLKVLSLCGCDILLLQYHGDSPYLAIDEHSWYSEVFSFSEVSPFPIDFSLKKIRNEIAENTAKKQLYGGLSAYKSSINSWITGNVFEDVIKDTVSRGTDDNIYYNCCYRIRGVEDKVTYQDELYRFQQELREKGRRLLIINNKIEIPTASEINKIKRSSYQTVTQLIQDLGRNIQYPESAEIQKLLHKAFVDTILEIQDEYLNIILNKAVYLLCWIKKYQTTLFGNWKYPEIACLIYMGVCNNDAENLFFKFMSMLPVDIVIFSPDLKKKCCLSNIPVGEITFEQSMTLTEFPDSNTYAKAGTAAFHAEQEINTLLYHDTGIYRNQQYKKANTLILQTIYEEISILWNQEVRYRPNFSTNDDTVNIPVIFSKISGVKDGKLSEYWDSIKKLITSDTMVLKNDSFVTEEPNPIKPYATDFLKNGYLKKTLIKNHKTYTYGILREPIQDYLLDKIQKYIEKAPIKGMGLNGTEFTVVATLLNLNPQLLRMIQNMDFTKKNPKLIYINTNETMLSLEDTICISFLNFIGFDVLFFIPTGYHSIEHFFNKVPFTEHQIGEYLYDLSIPSFEEKEGFVTHYIKKIKKHIIGN